MPEQSSSRRALQGWTEGRRSRLRCARPGREIPLPQVGIAGEEDTKARLMLTHVPSVSPEAPDTARPGFQEDSAEGTCLPAQLMDMKGLCTCLFVRTYLRTAHLKVISRKRKENLRKALKQLLKQRIRM